MNFLTLLTSILVPLTLIKADQCPDGNQCPKSTTCCQLPEGEYGCCVFPNATCCGDHTHCCPENHSCNLEQQTCVPNSGIEQNEVPKTPTKILAVATKILEASEVKGNSTLQRRDDCPGTECPGGCCEEHVNAFCCPDNIFCCPSGSVFCLPPLCM